MKIRVDKDIEITGELIQEIITQRGDKPSKRFKKLQNYYEGEHDILERTKKDPSKPNNRLVVNYAKLITDIATGYFVGIPVTYNSDEKEALKEIFDVLDANYEEDVNYELAKQISISGTAFELIYANEDSDIEFKPVDNASIIPVYTDCIQERLLFAIRMYETNNILTGEKKHKAEVYTDIHTIYFEQGNGTMTEVERNEHFFGDVPVIEYTNNNESLGDFEVVLSLIDAYNKTQSDSANDFEDFTDAFLYLVGYNGTQSEDVEQMKEDKVLLLDKEGSAGWLIKNINDAAVENYKNRLQADIHSVSQTPDLTDEKFAGNVSGESMKYKTWGLEQVSAIKERKFKTGLIKRLKLISNYLNIKGGNFDPNLINLTFHRNLPKNLLEITDMFQKLGGSLSEKTTLSLHPAVDDPDAEIARKEEDAVRKGKQTQEALQFQYDSLLNTPQ